MQDSDTHHQIRKRWRNSHVVWEGCMCVCVGGGGGGVGEYDQIDTSMPFQSGFLSNYWSVE